MEEFVPNIESQEGGGQTAETSKEASEKLREAIKKSGAKVQRTQKDEKKAKKSDYLLAGFLVKIIIDKKYDELLDQLFKIMDAGYPSHLLLGILSLIHIELSNKIRELSNKTPVTFNYQSVQTVEFDDNHLAPEIKNRVNAWVEDMGDAVSLEYSSLMTQKLIEKIKNDHDIIHFTAKVFTFFLKETNINIQEKKALSISEFILTEVEKSLKKLKIEEI